MTDERDRNPLFVPETKSRAPSCPKCGESKFSGRRVQGVVTFTCPCGNKWQGGLPQEPMDPRVPYPADPNPPGVEYVANHKSPTGVDELRRAPDTRQEFRKGAQVKEDE